jgi:hypothetical protein
MAYFSHNLEQGTSLFLVSYLTALGFYIKREVLEQLHNW